MKKISASFLSLFALVTVWAQNPYLPLWEHLPDGEPRVFEDPDQPGKYRVTGKKTYYLYPHSRGRGRVATVCRSDRPDGPFVPVNVTEDGRDVLPGSIIDFDPSVFVETITDRKDPDYGIGFSKPGVPCERPVVPKVRIFADGKELAVPATPVRFTNANGIMDQLHYQVYAPLKDDSVLQVSVSDPDVLIWTGPVVNGRATVKCSYKGLEKTYWIN